MEEALAGFAQRRALKVLPGPVRWFDGFWDFSVPARAALDASACLHVHGADFLVLLWAPSGTARLDVFVERKARGTAPWPVGTVELPGGAPSTRLPVERVMAERPLAALVARGFTVRASHWGPHLTHVGEPRFDAPELEAVLEEARALLP